MPKHTDLEHVHDGEVVTLYVIAGIATSPDFMEGLRLELERRYRAESGSDRIRSVLLHPYGAWNRSIWPQLRELRRDLRLRIGRRAGSLGGARVLARLAADGAAQSGPLWLVGHSGGGVAAVHAAEALLAADGAADCRIVQVGSPRCAVPEPLQRRTAYLYAARPDGRVNDPICRFGSWGGWGLGGDGAGGRIGSGEGERRNRWPGWFGRLRWCRNKHAPLARVPLPLVGGHADYFRSGAAYRQGEDGISNLELIVEAMWPTLTGKNDDACGVGGDIADM